MKSEDFFHNSTTLDASEKTWSWWLETKKRSEHVHDRPPKSLDYGKKFRNWQLRKIESSFWAGSVTYILQWRKIRTASFHVLWFKKKMNSSKWKLLLLQFARVSCAQRKSLDAKIHKGYFMQMQSWMLNNSNQYAIAKIYNSLKILSCTYEYVQLVCATCVCVCFTVWSNVSKTKSDELVQPTALSIQPARTICFVKWIESRYIESHMA